MKLLCVITLAVVWQQHSGLALASSHDQAEVEETQNQAIAGLQATMEELTLKLLQQGKKFEEQLAQQAERFEERFLQQEEEIASLKSDLISRLDDDFDSAESAAVVAENGELTTCETDSCVGGEVRFFSACLFRQIHCTVFKPQRNSTRSVANP